MDVMSDQELERAIEDLVGTPSARGSMTASVHDAASPVDRMLIGWDASLGSGDADIIPEKMLIDARYRDARRNDGYVQAGENQHKDSIVGAKFLLNAKPATAYLLGKEDEQWESEFQEEIETKFELAADGQGNYLDASGAMSFTSMVRLAVGVGMATNEVVATAEWDRDTARPFKTCVQLIESDRLSTPWEFSLDENVRGGVRINQLGRAVGLYIRQSHPGDIYTAFQASEWKYVPMKKPWGRDQAILLRDPKRPGETRCVADLTAALKEVRTTHKFRDIMIQNAITNGMFAAAVESELPSDVIAAQLGGAGAAGAGDLAAQYAAGYMNALAAYTKNTRGIKIDGVRIPHLFPGTKLNLMPAGTPGGVGSDFEVALLRYVAATMGLSYEEFSRDYSKTNYSSIKAAINATYRYQQARKKIFADGFANKILALWFEEQMNAGNIETMKYSRLPNFYESLNSIAYTRAEWIGADFGQIDELKESQASVLRLKSNTSTFEREFGRRGRDWRREFRQIAREKRLMEVLDIVPVDQDPNMMNAASGTAREPDNTDGESKQ